MKTMYAPFTDGVIEVYYEKHNTMLINCNNCEGPERKTCQKRPCCAGEDKNCPKSCHCPNNKKEDVK